MKGQLLRWIGGQIIRTCCKDEEAGGTWLGTNKEGKFAAITNLKEILITNILFLEELVTL